MLEERKENKVWIGRWREEVPVLEGSIRMVAEIGNPWSSRGDTVKRDAERELWEHLKPLNVGREGASGPMTLRRFAEEV